MGTGSGSWAGVGSGSGVSTGSRVSSGAWFKASSIIEEQPPNKPAEDGGHGGENEHLEHGEGHAVDGELVGKKPHDEVEQGTHIACHEATSLTL